MQKQLKLSESLEIPYDRVKDAKERLIAILSHIEGGLTGDAAMKKPPLGYIGAVSPIVGNIRKLKDEIWAIKTGEQIKEWLEKHPEYDFIL